MGSQQIGESSATIQRPDNVKICRSMEMVADEIRNAILRNNNVLIVLCFVAKWSDKCKHMEKVINDLAENEKDVIFITADIDDMKALAWSWTILEVPSYVLLKREYIVEAIHGLNRKVLVDNISKWKATRVLQPCYNNRIVDQA